MAQVEIPGGLQLPDGSYLVNTIITNVYVIDASGEVAAFVCRVPKTGSLTRFEALISAIGNTPDNGLRFSFQDVDLSTGLPDGFAAQFATIPSGSLATGWANPGDFDAARSVTRGDRIALVCEIPGFTAGDSISIGATVSSAYSPTFGFPYGVSALSTKQSTGTHPCFALRYSDGTYAVLRFCMPYETVTTVSPDTGTTPDEVGITLTPTFPCTLGHIAWWGQVPAGGDYDVVIYDSGGSPVETLPVDGDVTGSIANRLHYQTFAGTEVLSVGSLYRVVLKPTTLNNLVINYATFASAALMDAIPGGQGMYMTQRTDAGAWTNYNNGTDGFRRPMIQLFLEGFDSGGGGVNRAALPSGVSALG